MSANMRFTNPEANANKAMANNPNQPELVLEQFFNGRTFATGLFEDRFGNIRNQFTVTIDGDWDGRTLILDEDFRYIDGSKERRVWHITKHEDNRYIGVTDNVEGSAAGEIRGNVFRWRYLFRLQVGDKTWRVKFDDWMLLQPDGTLLNRATVYRWGIRIGTAFLSFHRPVALAVDQHSAANDEEQPRRQRTQ